MQPRRRWRERNARHTGRVAGHRHFLRPQQVVVFAEINLDAALAAAAHQHFGGDRRACEHAARRGGARQLDIAVERQRPQADREDRQAARPQPAQSRSQTLRRVGFAIRGAVAD